MSHGDNLIGTFKFHRSARISVVAMGTKTQVQYPAELAYEIPYFWLNPNKAPAATVLPKLPLTREDMEEAKALWDRMAPLISHCFPDVKGQHNDRTS